MTVVPQSKERDMKFPLQFWVKDKKILISEKGTGECCLSSLFGRLCQVGRWRY